MVTVPTSFVALAGVKLNWIAQELPGGNPPVQPLLSEKFPEIVTFVNVTLKVPVLVTFTVCVNPLLVLTTWGMKLTVVGVTTSVFVGVTPVPVNVTVRGLPGALSVILTEPLRVPAAKGVNVTVNWH